MNQSRLSQGLAMMRRLSRPQKVLAGLVVFFLFYTVTGFIVLPLVVRAVLTDKGSIALHRDVIVADVNINPYTFKLQIKELTVRDHDGEALTTAKEVMINIQSYSLFKRALVITDLVTIIKAYTAF